MIDKNIRENDSVEQYDDPESDRGRLDKTLIVRTPFLRDKAYERPYSRYPHAKLLSTKFNLDSLLSPSSLNDLYDICDSLEYTYEFGRGTHWLGEEGLDYKYTNTSHIAGGWHSTEIKLITQIMRTATAKFGFNVNNKHLYNHLLINQYQPKQKLNMHKDDEPELTGPIASLSLGASTYFEYNNTKSKRGSVIRDLEHGSVMIGNREFFNEYYHSVAPIKRTDPFVRAGGVRYNLTWRTIRGDSNG